MNSVIDTHVHIYPAPYLDMLEKAGVDPASTKIARNLELSPVFRTGLILNG